MVRKQHFPALDGNLLISCLALDLLYLYLCLVSCWVISLGKHALVAGHFLGMSSCHSLQVTFFRGCCSVVLAISLGEWSCLTRSTTIRQPSAHVRSLNADLLVVARGSPCLRKVDICWLSTFFVCLQAFFGSPPAS